MDQRCRFAMIVSIVRIETLRSSPSRTREDRISPTVDICDPAAVRQVLATVRSFPGLRPLAAIQRVA